MSQSAKDPLFGLKYIAYCRTGLPLNEEDLDEEAFVSFAKWQICKIRNRLWLDPIWDLYSREELIVEYFSIKFDENDSLRKQFETGMQEFKKSDIDQIEMMERRYLAQQASEVAATKTAQPDIINESPVVNTPPEEFEDKF